MRSLFVHFAVVTLELLMLRVSVVFDKCVSIVFSMDGMVWVYCYGVDPSNSYVFSYLNSASKY